MYYLSNDSFLAFCLVLVNSTPNMGLKLLIPRSKVACSRTEPAKHPQNFEYKVISLPPSLTYKEIISSF